MALLTCLSTPYLADIQSEGELITSLNITSHQTHNSYQFLQHIY